MSRLKPRSRFVIPFLIVIFGVGIFQTSNIEQRSTISQQKFERKPNAFSTGTKLRQFDEFGQLVMEIDTIKSYYYRDERLIETTQPTIRYRNEQNERLKLDAEQGQYMTDTGILTLENSVVLSRTTSLGDVLTFETEDLLIDSRNDFITTDHEVKIHQGSSSLSAIGMNASLTDRKLELTNRVRGRYDIAN